MRKNILREKLRQDEPTIGTRVVTPWAGMIDVIGQIGDLDYVEFSGEYSSFSLHDLDNIARACELSGLSSMIKVDQSIQTFLAQRGIGAGFQNILFTDIRSAEDARECVRAVRAETPMAGGINPAWMRRSVGYFRDGGSPEFVQAMNDAVVAIMIEKKSAVENLEDILAVDGIDMVQFGPSDYSMSLGIPGQRNHADVKKAEMRVIETALKMGVVPRVEIFSPGQAREYMEMGIKHFNIGIDIIILHRWLKENTAELRNLLK